MVLFEIIDAEFTGSAKKHLQLILIKDAQKMIWYQII